MKKLDTAAGINAMVIANLSGIIKDIVIQSHNKFQQITHDILWGVTLRNYSELCTVIKQLEFALLQMIHQSDELIGTVQSVLQGKLPISLINPTKLQGILRNKSLQLPEGYEFIVGTKTDKIYLYYELVQVSVIGDVHNMKLIVNVPVKTANSQFKLYKVVALPTRVSKTNSVKYCIDCFYFGLENSRNDYVLFKGTNLLNCVTGEITVCPANTAVYSAITLKCLPSIFFRTSTYNSLCRRQLLVNLRTPTLQKHKSLRLYYFPEQRQVTLRCLKDNAWTTRTEIHVLSEAGLILNASSCSITTEEFRTFPKLHGSMQTTLDRPNFYIPDKVSTVADHEIPLLEKITPKEIQQMNEVRSRVITPSQTFDVDSLFHLRQVSLHQEQRTFWHLTVTNTVCTLAVLGNLYFSLRSHVHNFVPCCHSINTTIEPSTVTSNLSPVIPEPSQRTQFPRNDEPQRDVTFTAYPLKQAEC